MAVPNASDVQAFSAIVGEAHVRPAAAEDELDGVRPQTVVEPANEGEVAEVLRAANGAGLAVIPRGGGTKIGWGQRPARADVLLSMARLNRVLDHPWADLTVTVEAGCPIASLQSQIARHGQHVAIDVLWPERATIGGILSTNDSGALRLRYGALRDLIIGVTLALPDGTLASSGGKVVKNVAGYDLPKLATGAFGTLGVITRAVFRLHPLPQRTATWTCTAGTLDKAQQLLTAVQDSRLAHSSLQLRADANGACFVDVRFEGGDAGIAAQFDELKTLTAVAWDGTPESPNDVWQAREALWNHTGAILKIGVLPTDVSEIVGLVRAAGPDLVWRAVAYATGLIWMQIESADGTRRAIEAARKFTASHGGSAIVLRRASSEPNPDVWGPTGDAHPLMVAIKHQFDPGRILNPGRFVGGI